MAKAYPSVKSCALKSCALVAGVLSAAAFVAAPSTASAQLQLEISAFETDRITLSLSRHAFGGSALGCSEYSLYPGHPWR